MPIARFLGCFLCGKDKGVGVVEDGDVPVIRIEGKSAHHQLSDSSFDSELEFSSAKDEKDTPLSTDTEPRRTNKALVVAAKGTYALVDHEFPNLEHGREVVIRNMATGLNPIDFKSVDFNFCLPEFPWVTGREMAGVVEVVGEEVEGIRVGDRVWTSTYYRDRRAGCFQQFVTVPAHTVLPLPSNLSFDEAACLGVAALTAAMTLWRWLQVPMVPPAERTGREYLLVWGGSTVTGQFAIQIAARCGLDVIAVTSAKTRSLAESLGARVVVRDGKSNDEIVDEIRGVAGEDITRAIDLVGPSTANYCLKAFSRDEGRKCLFAPLAMISSKAEIPANVVVETVEMKQFVLDGESRRFAVELNRLVESGEILLPGLEVLEGGLGVVVVVEGLERLKRGDMVGRKMVVRMES
ncbi:GroES-like protein [Mollisia scopiformis]|uniref:GroES-like protein n=1 Tax=Mollisia scopiformis TaxID=149040 RepID=A0A194XKI8_MOLSC|nr:GroES-like protein [Mollisia scopiformis]KUJ20656.1 GroES-like protein [Mollisia scopiformis]